MGAAEITAAAAVAGAGAAVYSASQSGKGGSGSNGTGSPTDVYSPVSLQSADSGWLNDFENIGSWNQDAALASIPAYQDSYVQNQNINYDQYQQAANTAGQQMDALSSVAGQQAGYYGQAADQARQAGQQVYQTAFDPQNALYDRTQQQLTDQVRAGQAARGIGLSGEGAVEENGAMSNFNIDWQNNQLQRQTQGVSAMNSANQYMGADMAAQLSAGQAQAQYGQEGAQIPLTAQQYVAGQPAANANAYGQNIGNLNTMYANQANMAIPYMNAGQGAQQFNVGYNTQQNAANAKLLTQGIGGLASAATNYFGNQASNSSGWMNNVNTSNGGFGANGQDSNSAANGGNIYSDYGSTGYDAYYGG